MVRAKLIGLLALSAVVLAVALALAIFPTYRDDVFSTLTEPNQINDTIIVDTAVDAALSILYNSHRTSEFVTCLDGMVKRNGDVVVSGITSTKIIETGRHSVVFVSCPAKSLGAIHNHPSGSCLLSRADAFSFGDQRNHEITGVICGAGKYSFYTRDNVFDSLTVKIQKT